jgi:hypothetical protein
MVVSTLSAGSYAVQASFSGDKVYTPSTSSTLNRPASLGAGDLTVAIDGLPTTDYPHSRFRNPQVQKQSELRFTKPDGGSVVSPAEPHIRLTVRLFSPNQKVKHSMLCRNSLLIFRLVRGTMPVIVRARLT